MSGTGNEKKKKKRRRRRSQKGPVFINLHYGEKSTVKQAIPVQFDMCI